MDQDTSPKSSAGDLRKPTLFSKDFLLAILLNLSITTVFFLLVTGMAVYAASEFGAGETAAGFAASAFVVGAIFARIFAGKYVNTLGRKPILVICMAIYTVAGVLYPVVGTFEGLILLRLAHGIALGFGQTALTAAVFDIIPRSRRGEGSGYYLIANSLPPAIGPLAAIQLTAHFGFAGMFTTVSAVSLVSFVIACFIRTPEVKDKNQPLRERLALRPSDIIEPRVLPIATVTLLLGVTFASIMAFLNGFAQELEMVSAASWFFVVYSATMLIARLFMGKVQDRFGDNPVMFPALIGYVFSMALLAWAPNELAIIVAGALAGFGFGSILPAIQAMIAAKLRTHRISIGVSTFFILMDSGFGLAPLALGPVVESFGYQTMYSSCVVVVILAVVVYWFVHGRYGVRQGIASRHQENWVNDATGVMPQVRGDQERRPDSQG